MQEITVISNISNCMPDNGEHFCKEGFENNQLLLPCVIEECESYKITRDEKGKIAAVFMAEIDCAFKVTLSALLPHTTFQLDVYPDHNSMMKQANEAGIVEFRLVLNAGQYFIMAN